MSYYIKMRDKMRFEHMALKTEEAYLGWVKDSSTISLIWILKKEMSLISKST